MKQYIEPMNNKQRPINVAVFAISVSFFSLFFVKYDSIVKYNISKTFKIAIILINEKSIVIANLHKIYEKLIVKIVK
jgi:uncharacterized membrane protein YwzB